MSSDAYRQNQALAQRRAIKLRGGQPAKASTQSAERGGEVLGALKEIAAQQGDPAQNPAFADSLGLLPPSDPGFDPSYWHANSAPGYQHGFHQPMVPHGLPPETMSMPEPTEFAMTPMGQQANPGAMAPSGVAARADAARNGANAPLVQRAFQDRLAALQKVAKAEGNIDPFTKNYQYSSGKLQDQPWFDEYVAAGRAFDMQGDQASNTVKGHKRMPTVQYTGPKPERDTSFAKFQDWYKSDEQQMRRAKRMPQDAKGNILSPDQVRDMRKRRALERDNPELLVERQRMQDIGNMFNDQGGGKGGLNDLLKVGMAFGGNAMGQLANAQALMAQNEMLHQRGMADAANNKQFMDAQAAAGGLPAMINHFGGAEQMLAQRPGVVQAEINKSLAQHNNWLPYVLQDMAKLGLPEALVYKAMGGNFPAYNGWLGATQQNQAEIDRLHRMYGNPDQQNPAPAPPLGPVMPQASGNVDILGMLRKAASIFPGM